MENTMTEEQMENIKSQIIEAVKPVIKVIMQIYENIKDYFVKLWLELRTFIEEIDKFYKIYKRTKNKRIQKKQISKIIKILQKYKKIKYFRQKTTK